MDTKELRLTPLFDLLQPRCSAIVKLYLGQGSSWAFTGLVGALCLVPEVAKKAWVLRFVNLDVRALTPFVGAPSCNKLILI
jgi:hypothetical protein